LDVAKSNDELDVAKVVHEAYVDVEAVDDATEEDAVDVDALGDEEVGDVTSSTATVDSW